MSFFRHREIYPSEGSACLAADAPAHRLDEFPADYSLPGWSPPEPASASPAGNQYAVQSSCWSSTFQRMANCVLTVCVSPGGKSILRSGYCGRGWHHPHVHPGRSEDQRTGPRETATSARRFSPLQARRHPSGVPVGALIMPSTLKIRCPPHCRSPAELGIIRYSA
jgi:hypothetical protein